MRLSPLLLLTVLTLLVARGRALVSAQSEKAVCTISADDDDYCARLMYTRKDVVGAYQDAVLEARWGGEAKDATGKTLAVVVLPISNQEDVKLGNQTKYKCTEFSFCDDGDIEGILLTKQLASPDDFLSYTLQSTGLFVAYIPSSPTLRTELNISSDTMYKLTWKSPYGLLDAPSYPKLIFYGVIALIYLLIGITWVYFTIKYWREILPIQNYLSALIFLVMIEMAFWYGYYNYFNKNGYTSPALFVLALILNAGRFSFSVFLLLIVSLGYGVVKPSLGDTMRRCQILGGFQFAFTLLYAWGSLVLNENSSFWLVLLFVLPISTVMTLFYWWTLHALTQTRRHLEERRQLHKLGMYTNLWQILSFSIMAIMIYMIVNTLFFSGYQQTVFGYATWKFRWFVLDGFPNLLYMGVFLAILWLWRPTENNQRYGLEELPDEDDDIEIGAISSSRNDPTRKRDVVWEGEDHGEDMAADTDHDDSFEYDGLTPQGRRNIHQEVLRAQEDEELEDPEEVLKWVEKHVGLSSGSGGRGKITLTEDEDDEVDVGESTIRNAGYQDKRS